MQSLQVPGWREAQIQQENRALGIGRTSLFLSLGLLVLLLGMGDRFELVPLLSGVPPSQPVSLHLQNMWSRS